MFYNVPKAVLHRMLYLEQVDAEDRKDGTPHLQPWNCQKKKPCRLGKHSG